MPAHFKTLSSKTRMIYVTTSAMNTKFTTTKSLNCDELLLIFRASCDAVACWTKDDSSLQFVAQECGRKIIKFSAFNDAKLNPSRLSKRNTLFRAKQKIFPSTTERSMKLKPWLGFIFIFPVVDSCDDYKASSLFPLAFPSLSRSDLL